MGPAPPHPFQPSQGQYFQAATNEKVLQRVLMYAPQPHPLKLGPFVGCVCFVQVASSYHVLAITTWRGPGYQRNKILHSSGMA